MGFYAKYDAQFDRKTNVSTLEKRFRKTELMDRS